MKVHEVEYAYFRHTILFLSIPNQNACLNDWIYREWVDKFNMCMAYLLVDRWINFTYIVVFTIFSERFFIYCLVTVVLFQIHLHAGNKIFIYKMLSPPQKTFQYAYCSIRSVIMFLLRSHSIINFFQSHHLPIVWWPWSDYKYTNTHIIWASTTHSHTLPIHG